MKIINMLVVTTSLLIAGCYVWPTIVRTTQSQVIVDHHHYTTYQNCNRRHYGYYDSYRYYHLPYSYYYRYQRPAIIQPHNKPDKPTIRKNDRTRLRDNDGNRTRPQNNDKPRIQTREQKPPPKRR